MTWRGQRSYQVCRSILTFCDQYQIFQESAKIPEEPFCVSDGIQSETEIIESMPMRAETDVLASRFASLPDRLDHDFGDQTLKTSARRATLLGHLWYDIEWPNLTDFPEFKNSKQVADKPNRAVVGRMAQITSRKEVFQMR